MVRLRKLREIQIFTKVMGLTRVLMTGQNYLGNTNEKLKMLIKSGTSMRDNEFICRKLFTAIVTYCTKKYLMYLIFNFFQVNNN